MIIHTQNRKIKQKQKHTHKTPIPSDIMYNIMYSFRRPWCDVINTTRNFKEKKLPVKQTNCKYKCNKRLLLFSFEMLRRSNVQERSKRLYFFHLYLISSSNAFHIYSTPQRGRKKTVIDRNEIGRKQEKEKKKKWTTPRGPKGVQDQSSFDIIIALEIESLA